MCRRPVSSPVRSNLDALFRSASRTSCILTFTTSRPHLFLAVRRLGTMKSLRKSLNNRDTVRSQISAPSPLPSVSKPATSIQPPKKVIRALATSQTAVAQGLSFNKGDFFYVTKDVDSWYEAHNPATGARGLVPKDMFEEFGKGGNTYVIRSIHHIQLICRRLAVATGTHCPPIPCSHSHRSISPLLHPPPRTAKPWSRLPRRSMLSCSTTSRQREPMNSTRNVEMR